MYMDSRITLPYSSVAMRLGPVLAGPVHSRVSALRGVSLLCVVLGGGGGVSGGKTIIALLTFGSSVAIGFGPVPGTVRPGTLACVGAAGRFAAVCCVRWGGGCSEG